MVAPQKLLDRLVAILDQDEKRLQKIDRYIRGEHDAPYAPDNATQEFRDIEKRAITPLCGLALSTATQMLYLESYRRSAVGDDEAPEIQWWRESRMPARQMAVYRAALGYGHSFVLVEKGRDGRPSIKGLSPLRTSAIFLDPANDEDPFAVYTIDIPRQGEMDGRGRLWTDTHMFPVAITADGIKLKPGKKHGFTSNPVTRFAAAVDLEGRTVGVVEPLIGLQDRVNQTVFDQLIAQTYGSFKVRYVTGMAPPIETDANGEPVIKDGKPVPKKININATRMMFAENPEVEFGTLDHTPLNGYIDAVQEGFSQFAALSQTPPHYLLGKIANLSAEALTAAETALARRVEEFRTVFGAAWGRVFRLCAELMGDEAGAGDYTGEVIWRDMDRVSIGAVVDGLGKAAEMLDIPRRGLWPRMPNVTQTELDYWQRIRDEDNPELTLSRAVLRDRPRRTAASVRAPEEERELTR